MTVMKSCNNIQKWPDTKKEIREAVRSRRSAMTLKEVEDLSALISSMVIKTEEFKKSQTIYLYASFRNEVKTDKILETALNSGKKVAMPKVMGSEMEFYYISSKDELIPGYMGIREPETDKPANDISVLIIIPGLAFDTSGHRIGYGRGYYDRYLQGHSHISFTKMALCYDLQLVDNIKTESHDQTVDIIITPEKEYHTGH